MTRLYINCADASVHSAVRARFPTAVIDPPSEFASVESDFGQFSPGEANRLAREFNAEVIYLAFSSVTDSFQFTRSVLGETVRHLQHGMYVEQGLWEEVTGVAEGWESAAFFSPSSMRILEHIGPDDLDRERIIEIYKRHTVVAGGIYPMIDARESARAVAKHYRLTDWLDDWKDSPRQALNSSSHKTVSAARQKPWWRFW